MFSYTLASDLHLDTGHGGTPLARLPWQPYVVLAGDLGNGLGHFGLVEKLKAQGRAVFAVDGNHEHYANLSQKRTLLETETRFYERLGAISGAPGGRQSQVVCLRDDLFLIGCNGWYAVDDAAHWRGYMNDGFYGAFSAATVNAAAERHAAFVDDALATLPPGAKAIVVTHTAPCAQSLDPRFEGSEGNSYYWNPWMERVLRAHAPIIKIWHHGHIHAPVDVVHAGVRVVTTPRGYPGEIKNWRPRALEA